MTSERSRLFTIPSGAPFLDTLVGALLDGVLVPGFDARSDPFALSDATIYLPTRRAARAIRASFIAALGRPVLLPRIRTLADVDEDESAFDPSTYKDASLPPAISPLDRQLHLTRLVLAWSGALVRSAAGFPDEELLVPASPADAARLAASLGQVIDQVGIEPQAWAGLAGVAPDLTKFHEITLDFLRIVIAHWPAHLAEQGLMDPGARRDALIRREAARLLEHPPRGPVIAAGSTGSVPATAELLAAISRLPNGAVVLPGLDQDLEDDAWRELADAGSDPAIAGHPQFGLRKLLDRMEVRREDVIVLGESRRARERLVSEAMRPAGTTERWSTAPRLGEPEKAEALNGVSLVEAANEREEALAAALILRSAAEIPGRVAALVTPDRNLARRVAVELRRWAIEVDDSGGRPLATTPPGVFARLLADTVCGGFHPETLLALLKHPCAAFGLPAGEARQAARILERAVLRGPRLASGMAALRHAFDLFLRNAESADGWRDLPRAATGLSSRERASAAALLERLEASLAPLCALASERDPVPLARLVEAHRTSLDMAACDGEGQSTLGDDEASRVLVDLFAGLMSAAPSGPELTPAEYPAFFAALMDGRLVRRSAGTDPRIHIWGALEARLQHVDVMVLGGLNEGTWPTQTALDPLLSRAMRAELALDPPERRIGLAAHDFAQELGHAEVWLTRAERENGEPRVASRWLQRLTAYIGEDAKELRRHGAEIVTWARALDRPDAGPASVRRPAPKPSAALRPKSLSATEIETLIRDPYAIYARHVLKLRPFGPIGKEPDAAERGSLIHGILEKFVREHESGPFDDAALSRLLQIGRTEFERFADFPEIGTLWWPRFEKIAKWFVNEEQGRADTLKRQVELSGKMAVSDEFTLTARADRIDRLESGGVVILDYKTGAPPSEDEVLSFSAQLPLEALVVEAGGFTDIPAAKVERLEYYRLSGQGKGGEAAIRGARGKAKPGKPAQTVEQTIAVTGERLRELAAAFADESTPYLSRKIPRLGRDFGGDYDHLARVGEWGVEGEEAE